MERFKKFMGTQVGTAVRWTIPSTAVGMLALSIARLNITPPGLQGHADAMSTGVVDLIPDPFACATLSSMLLVYWAAKDGKHAIEDAAKATQAVTGIPGFTKVCSFLEVTMRTLIKRLSQEVREEAKAEGKAEGKAETNQAWSEWLKRRTESGEFIWDDDDPLPE